MSDVPSEIFREILVRLPAESLFRFRSVCKTWLQIIDDPSFIKSHTNNQLHSHTLLVRSRDGAPYYSYSFSLDSLNFIKGPQKIEATRIKQLIRRGVPLLPPIYYQPFCNGLILLSCSDNTKVWTIWNPLTKDFHYLPQPDILCSKLYRLCGLGFGYDYQGDDYKVVRIHKSVSERKLVYQTLIYSLKSDSWRKIGDWPCHNYMASIYLNGTLYWHYDDAITALDLATESYFQISWPPVDIKSEKQKHDGFGCDLQALDGCLICVLDYNRRYVYDGWVMQDNGGEKSWIKLFSLQYSFHMSYCRRDELSGRLNLVAYLKRKQQVVLQHDWGFLWFDIGKNSVLKFSIHGLPEITSSKICPGSLVRLGGRAVGVGAVTARGTLTRKRKRNTKTKRKDTRLKFCVRNTWEKCCSDKHYCSEDSCRCCKEE